MRTWILTCPVKRRKHKRIGERILVDWDGVDYMARIENIDRVNFIFVISVLLVMNVVGSVQMKRNHWTSFTMHQRPD